MTTTYQKSAEQVFDDAFQQAREPRSDAYKAGVLACLQVYMCGAKFMLCYGQATAEHDAWLSGWIEGRDLFSQLQLDSKHSAKQVNA